MPAIGAAGITEGTHEAGCGKWDIRAEGIGCRLTTRAVNRNCDWFKTRHSLAIDVRKRMRGQAAPDGDRSRAWQVRRCRRRMGVGVRGLSREPQPGFPVCQRMPVPGRRPRGTPGHSGTQSTGFRAWLTKKMEAANGFGGVVNHTIHFTPAAHGPQSASPCGCHQGRHAPPDANWWDETRILCRRPSGLVGLRLTQVGGCLFPIGVRLKTRKLSGLWAICEQQGPNPAGGSATTGGRALQEASAKDAESCWQG